MICVIVDDGNDEGGEVWVRAMQHNVVDFAEEDLYAEAALNQHPNILKSTNKLCRALAECRLDEEINGPWRRSFMPNWQRRQEETQAAELLTSTSSGVSRRKTKKTRNTFMLKTIVFLCIVKTSFLCSPLE
jgi:hypothetical protein